MQVCPRCRSCIEPTETVNSWQQIELPEIKPLIHQIDLITCKYPRCHPEERPVLVMRVGEIVSYAIIARQDCATLAGLAIERIVLSAIVDLPQHKFMLKSNSIVLPVSFEMYEVSQNTPEFSKRIRNDWVWRMTLCKGFSKISIGLEDKENSLSTWRQYGHIKWRSIQEELEELVKNGSTKKLRRFCTKLNSADELFSCLFKRRCYPNDKQSCRRSSEESGDCS